MPPGRRAARSGGRGEDVALHSVPVPNYWTPRRREPERSEPAKTRLRRRRRSARREVAAAVGDRDLRGVPLEDAPDLLRREAAAEALPCCRHRKGSRRSRGPRAPRHRGCCARRCARRSRPRPGAATRGSERRARGSHARRRTWCGRLGVSGRSIRVVGPPRREPGPTSREGRREPGARRLPQPLTSISRSPSRRRRSECDIGAVGTSTVARGGTAAAQIVPRIVVEAGGCGPRTAWGRRTRDVEEGRP